MVAGSFADVNPRLFAVHGWNEDVVQDPVDIVPAVPRTKT